MIFERTERFKKAFKKLPKEIQSITEEKFELMRGNPQHPSLRIKKMSGTNDIWEGSITHKYRFTFHIIGDIYLLRNIGPHDIGLRK